MSSPMDAAHRWAASATPEPLLDSPGVQSKFQGLAGTPQGGFWVPPMASSLMLSLPSSTLPASLNRWTTVESSSGMKSL